ncbi:hypothetical protein [Aureispira anguillae]|uniref:Uncharacterized protein n=1 Tax=Aureispira anguillae TaxID=2864201 RepID=A0A916DRC9_9BACT|nr:hypothetical protein [Aureispira anguillae]BDS10302.1 hypothetical protein AsAng_0010100 [Aureispira anguillae]
MNYKIITSLLLCFCFVISTNSNAQIGRFKIKKKPKTTAKTSTKASNTTVEKSNSTSSSKSSSSSSNSHASDKPQYKEGDMVYRNYSNAKSSLGSLKSYFKDSGWKSKEAYDGRVTKEFEVLNKHLTFLKDNGEGEKNYFKEMQNQEATYKAQFDKEIKEYKTIRAFQDFFDQHARDLERKSVDQTKQTNYETQLTEYQNSGYQSESIDSKLKKIKDLYAKNKEDEFQSRQLKLVKESDVANFETDFHKNNVGKVVFSNETIELKNVDASKLKNSFSFGEAIRFRVYYDQPIYNTIAKMVNNKGGLDTEGSGNSCYPHHKINYYLDGKLVHVGYYRRRLYNERIAHFPEDAKIISEWITFRGSLYIDKPAHEEQTQFKNLVLKMGKLSGKRKLTVEVVAFDYDNKEDASRSKILATGDIEIDFSKAVNFKTNPIFCMAAPINNSTALAVLKNHLKNKGINYKKIAITHFSENKPTRVIKAEIGTAREGKCYKYYVVYEQSYNYKTGRYEGPLKVTYGTEDEEIYCDCFN